MSEAGRKAPLGDGALRWSAQSCVPRRQSWRRTALEHPHPSGLCCSAGAAAGMASLAACSTWGGAASQWSAQSCVPRRQSWRWTALEHPHPSGLCCSAGATAGMASLAACSTWGGAASQWSAQSCVPRRQSWRRMALEHPRPSGLCCSAGAAAGMASLAACSTWGGAASQWSAQSCVPRRQSWRRMALELPYGSGVCCSAGAAAGMASLAACSTQRRTRTCGTEGGG